MRVCVAGGGLAGSALAWRLVQLPGVTVELLLGAHRAQDATSASGGAVRAYETLAEQRRLALASLAELLASRTLKRWSGFREGRFVYLRDATADLAEQVSEIERVLPGSAALMPAAEAFGRGKDGPCWGGPDGVAVVEQQAGTISPGMLRDAFIADLAGRPRARARLADLTAATSGPAGGVRCRTGDADGEHDVLVLAAGAWTPRLLHDLGYPAQAYRTRSIQFSSYDTGPWRPAAFADDRTGLYGKPLPGGGLTLGVPVGEWGAPAGSADVIPALHQRASRMAGECFPGLRLGPVRGRTSAVDCFADPPVLSLRAAPGADGSLLTFTGGSGGCVKTVLAASQRAALQISAGRTDGG